MANQWHRVSYWLALVIRVSGADSTVHQTIILFHRNKLLLLLYRATPSIESDGYPEEESYTRTVLFWLVSYSELRYIKQNLRSHLTKKMKAECYLLGCNSV
jgi:hypothetical protein